MGKINKLPPKIYNLIAAGEVVERPSSVVKELVENAIDANAKNVKVFLKNSGLEEIKVIDDGEGMDSADVLAAFLPHATSKIKTEYDLARISSLGFRGEAIASIASVSTMQIISSQDGLNGYQATYKAAVMQSNGLCAANKGTVVTVENLFFNTPARLKYLKSLKSELSSISYLMDRLALAHPEIRFTLINDNKELLKTTASENMTSLLGEIYGLEVAKALLETSFVADGTIGKIFLVKPHIYRANKLEITLIINGRFVKNYQLTNAVIEAYGTYLPNGKYPIVLIYLNIDPLLVDVNVHPSKIEVKLATEDKLKELIKSAVEKALQNQNLIPERAISSLPNQGYKKESIFNNSKLFLNSTSKPLANLKEESKAQEVIKTSKSKLPMLEYIGQAFGTYLIFQSDEGLYIVDQHAAAERINYEKNYRLLGDSHQPTSELLVPLLLTYTKSEAIFLEQHLAELAELGFKLEMISEQDFAVRQVPLWALEDCQDVVTKALSLMLENKKISVIDFRDEIAKQISCKSSIKANHALSRVEISALIERLGNCNNPFTCPHGRPTIIKFSVSDLEKMFERIQS